MAKKRRKPALITRRRGTVTITEAGRALLEAMSAEGNDQRTIARALNIGTATLSRCRERDEEVEEAWADGHAQLADEITHLLLQAGRKGHIVALIFLAKCRLGWIDQPKAEAPPPSITINLPDARSPEEHMRLLEYCPGEQIGETIQKSDIFGEIPKAKAVVR